MLPAELTMVNDLPIMNDAPRAHVPHGNDPQLLLYYLDHNTYPPEAPGIWVAAGRQAEVTDAIWVWRPRSTACERLRTSWQQHRLVAIGIYYGAGTIPPSAAESRGLC